MIYSCNLQILNGYTKRLGFMVETPSRQKPALAPCAPCACLSPWTTAAMEQQLNPNDPADGWSYAKFVRGNPTGARTIENLLQYAGFFAPVSFKQQHCWDVNSCRPALVTSTHTFVYQYCCILPTLIYVCLRLTRWVPRSYCGPVVAVDS